MLSRLQPIHAGEFSGAFVHRSIVIHNIDCGETLPLRHQKIIRIVRRGYFDRSGSEVLIHHVIGDDFQLSANDWKNSLLSDKVHVALILRVNSDSNIAKHSLGTGCGNENKAGGAKNRIFNIPERTLMFFVINLFIWESCLAARTPINQIFASINKSFFVEANENFRNRSGHSFVHCKPLPLPIAGKSHSFQLFYNAAAAVFFPLPNQLDKFFPAQVVTAFILLLSQHSFNHVLGGNAGVVGSRQPQRFFIPHPLKPDNNILNRIVKSMSHMQYISHVRRRDHNRVRLAVGIGFCMKIIPIQPELI